MGHVKLEATVPAEPSLRLGQYVPPTQPEYPKRCAKPQKAAIYTHVTVRTSNLTKLEVIRLYTAGLSTLCLTLLEK